MAQQRKHNPRKLQGGQKNRTVVKAEVDPASQPQVPPDTVPVGDETLPDGGLAQHPIHDDDLEDRDSEDYERDVDQLDSTDAVEPLDVTLRKQS